ncbi:MAG TPA: polysaccharide deacetylase family protein, partial [Pyrinomonadaceae bacterium]|nr:polysaccharide deacetylase family protein [Pyrinomonadaceae bacterium]
VPILLYHKIDRPAPDSLVRGGFTPPARFERQLVYLKKRGFVFYTASEMVEHYREHGSFPENGITLTLDDGWKDNYTNAFPVMKRLGIKATIFLVPTCIGQITDKTLLKGEGAREHLSRADILEMAGYGIEFGSHSLNHKWLHQLPVEEIRFEVEESKRQLEELLQKPCKVFAYPAGYFNEEARRVVEGAGHVGAVTTHYGPEAPPDPFALNRIEILRRDRFLFQFARKIAPLRDPNTSVVS